MKKVFGYFSFLFSLVILISCEPGRAENGDLLFGIKPAENGGIATKRLLKKIISHEKNEQTNLFEDSELTYNYNNGKLISSTDDSGRVTKFTYNSNNRINKIEGTGQTVDFEFTAGNVSKVTTEIAGLSKIVSVFTYTANKLTKTVATQEFLLPIPVKNYVETTYEYSGLNISKGLIKAGFYLPDGTLQMNPGTQSVSFTYDQKKSPYSLLPKELQFFIAGIAPQGASYFSTNNITKYVITTGGVSVPTEYVYTYDSLNFAVKNISGEDYVKYEYQ